jgi:hypothetical protein
VEASGEEEPTFDKNHTQTKACHYICTKKYDKDNNNNKRKAQREREREREGRTNVVGENTAIGETTGWFSGEGDAIGVLPRVGSGFPVACVSIWIPKDKELCGAKIKEVMMGVVVVVVVASLHQLLPCKEITHAYIDKDQRQVLDFEERCVKEKQTCSVRNLREGRRGSSRGESRGASVCPLLGKKTREFAQKQNLAWRRYLAN